MRTALNALILTIAALSCSGCLFTRAEPAPTPATSEFVTMTEFMAALNGIKAETRQAAINRRDGVVPDIQANMPNEPGATVIYDAERPHFHSGKLTVDPTTGKPERERETYVVKSTTSATIGNANKARAKLLGAALTDDGQPILQPNGRVALDVLVGYAEASEDTVEFGRDSSLIEAKGKARADQIAAALPHIETHYAGAIRLKEVRGETIASVIREGRETVLGVLERATPIGAAGRAVEWGAETAARLVTRDAAGSRTVDIPRPQPGGSFDRPGIR